MWLMNRQWTSSFPPNQHGILSRGNPQAELYEKRKKRKLMERDKITYIYSVNEKMTTKLGEKE